MMKTRRTCFISFIKFFLFSVLTRKKTIYEARVYSLISFLIYEARAVNFYILETVKPELGNFVENFSFKK